MPQGLLSSRVYISGIFPVRTVTVVPLTGSEDDPHHLFTCEEHNQHMK